MIWGAREAWIPFLFDIYALRLVSVCFHLSIILFKEKGKDILSILVEGGGEGIVLAFQAWMFLLENPQPNGSMVSHVPRSPTKNKGSPNLFLYFNMLIVKATHPLSLFLSV